MVEILRVYLVEGIMEVIVLIGILLITSDGHMVGMVPKITQIPFVAQLQVVRR